ncbi:MAG: glycosyltransferase family 4 protein [Nitrososphaerales archaeon]|nr:glycosyltransferase family 4 protein [Nitrososphaerales archaeon]
MKVLTLTWEYSPRIVGGISRHVEGLSEALVRRGAEVHVVTPDFPGVPYEEIVRGVHIHRVSVETPAPDFTTWVMLMNHYLAKRAADLANSLGGFDLVHAHDWLVTPVGIESKHFLGSDLITTLHSLEFKRVGSISSPFSRMVDSLEWWSTYESRRVIVCSNSMKWDVIHKFSVPEEKIMVIPNSIDTSKFDLHVDRRSVRLRYGVHNGERLVLFLGRLTPQKGCEYLIKAMRLLPSHLNAKLIVVGDGWMRNDLEREAFGSDIGWRVRFTGFLPDGEVVQLLKSADALVVPSVYEPFGMVALEGMAAGAPVVASNVDGLSEVIKHDYNGVLVYSRDPSSIAWGINRVLSDSGYVQWIVGNARTIIHEKYNWDAIASLTIDAYKREE